MIDRYAEALWKCLEEYGEETRVCTYCGDPMEEYGGCCGEVHGESRVELVFDNMVISGNCDTGEIEFL